MNLLFLTPRYFPHLGGVEYVVKSVAERLVKKGHDVTVLCGESSIDNPKEEWINGVHVYRWPVWAPEDAYHIPWKRGNLKKWLMNAVREFDVIHLHGLHSVLTVYSLNALENYGIHKVLTPHYHGTGHTAFRRLLWLAWRDYVRSALNSVSVIHTVSDMESKLIFNDFDVRSTTIGHGVEEWLSEIDWIPSNYVMYSGRIERYKNVQRLANIVKILNDMGLNLELKIFGSGPYTSELASHLNRIKLRFEMMPPQPYNKYIMYLSRASLSGLLSEKEAYGLTINEANAIGVPVVAVEPWGLSFSGRRRTLITQLDKSDEALAKEIAVFLDEARKQPKSKVPSWNQIVDVYLKKLYYQKLN